MGADQREEDARNMETNPGLPPFMRRWAKAVNDAITEGGGPGWYTTTTTSTTTTTTTSTTTTTT